MFISTLDLFKIGIGPSSSHTLGPMVAAHTIREEIRNSTLAETKGSLGGVRCILYGSLSYTGRGHSTDRGVLLGLHGYTAERLATEDVESIVASLWQRRVLDLGDGRTVTFCPETDIIFNPGPPLPEHPNGMIFEWHDETGILQDSWKVFSIGGGFICDADSLSNSADVVEDGPVVPYPFRTAKEMLAMAMQSGCSIAQMKRENERVFRSEEDLNAGLDRIRDAMEACVGRGLRTEGVLPGGLNVPRRAAALARQYEKDPHIETSDWLCAYAMAVNEENAAGHAVVTAPTNGAAGVLPAVWMMERVQRNAAPEDARDFLLTAGAIGGLIKHRSSISGAEVGCQGEVGSASAMAAAGLCALLEGSPQQVETAAEAALEHHLGLTCDPVRGLVQVPCIERNGFGAVKARTAARLAVRGSGKHFMSLDDCIEAMKQTGLEMSDKFKETAKGGLAVSWTEC